MKNLFVIALMTLLSTVTFANAEKPIKDKSNLTVEAEETNTAVILRLTNLEEERMMVYLKDDKNNAVFTKKMKATTEVALRLDLSKVKKGNYTLEVKCSAKSFVQDLTINKDGSVSVGEMTTWVKPILTKKIGKFVVTNPNNSVKSVKIYNTKGNLIYSNKYGKREKGAGKVIYNLGQVKGGKYTVIVSTFNDVFDYEIEISK